MANPALTGLAPTHPGAILREDVLPALGRPKAEIARLLGVSRQSLYDIINERQPLTANMALRIGKLCGNGPEFWMRLQDDWDLRTTEAEIGDQIEAIPTLTAA